MPDRHRQRSVDPVVEQEIKHEQAVVDRIYARLDAAIASAKSLATEGHARARLGNEGGLVERDAMVFQATKRLATLDAAYDGLVFGRLDLRDGDAHYIGRLGLRDERREVLLIDWRAPAASVFYQATAQYPAGVVRRRVLQARVDAVIGLDDDLLDAEHAPDDMVVVGEGALMAALTRSRDATMHSVVATIQKEQDEAVRSPHRGVTTISGGPGTGKTVVALHRAAYLLYTDRRRYEGGGVLVVGPNSVFMAYIERVLPSLGETSVSLRALGELVEGIEASRHDVAAVAAIKGSARMRPLLARTARGTVPGAPTSFRLFYRDDVLSIDGTQLGRLRQSLFSSGHRRNRIAPRVADELIDALWKQVCGERALVRGKNDFAAALLSDRSFTDFVRAWWPVVDAVDVLGWLADRGRLTVAARGLLTAEEVDELAPTLAVGDFSVEDVPLLDELRYLLGEPPEPEPDVDPLADLFDETFPELSTADQRGGQLVAGLRTGTSRPTGSIDDDGFAHVLVDEAQDLSPMQWRMVGRRGRQASWTIVGDAAQSSWPHPDEASGARREALAGKEQRNFRLSTNYRNAREVFALAAELAMAWIPGADLPTTVRTTGVQPQVLTVEQTDLAAATTAAVGSVTDAVDGTVGVVVPVGWRARVEEWLDGRDPDRVPVFEALDTKGLEFDGVVVVEPDEIVADSQAGIRTLYVVVTRATLRLHLVGTSSCWLPGADDGSLGLEPADGNLS